MPLLYSDNKMQKFNEDCDYVVAHAEQVLAGNGGNVQDFEHKCDDVLRQVAELKSVRTNGPTAIWLQQRYSQLVDIKYKIVAKHRNTAIRFAPFGVGLTGPSGVGKSTLSKLVMKTSLHAMGFETDPKRIITKDMFDKYDSTYTSDILGMFMDDVGNGKSDFAQVSPTDIIIKFFNNMAAQAVKAELNAKGVVFIAFKVGVLTSNFEDYQVRCYTNKPEAALRRFVHTRVRVKPKFRVPGGISLNTDHPELENCDLCKDVWELDLEECFIYEKKEGVEAYKFQILDVKLRDGTVVHCKNLDLPTYLDVIIALARKHKKKQTNVVGRSEKFDAMEMCDECSRPMPMCKCKLEPHGFEALGDIVIDAAKSSVTSYVNKWLSPVNFLNYLCGFRPIKGMATKQLAGEMTQVINQTATPFMVSITPDWLFRTRVFQKSIELWQHSAAMYDLRKQMKFCSILGTGCVGYGLLTRNSKTTGLALGGSWIVSMGLWAQYRARIRHYKNEYLARRDALPACAKEVRDSYVTKGAFVVSSLVVGLKLFQMWNKNRLAKKEMLDPAGLSKEEMESSPGWFGFMMKTLGVQVETSEASKRAHPSHLISTLEKSNLFWA
jgi:ABC-type oligopeptide transport system ATPase subunit